MLWDFVGGNNRLILCSLRYDLITQISVGSAVGSRAGLGRRRPNRFRFVSWEKTKGGGGGEKTTTDNSFSAKRLFDCVRSGKVATTRELHGLCEGNYNNDDVDDDESLSGFMTL